MANIDKYAKKTGFDREFLEWFFSAQSEREIQNTLKEREIHRKYQKKYMQENPEKAREMRKRAYEKIKKDPVKYQRYLARSRIYYRIYMMRIKKDPEKYQKYLEMNRIRSKKKYEKLKHNPEWLEKRKEEQKRYFQRLKQDPVKWGEYLQKKREYNRAYRKKKNAQIRIEEKERNKKGFEEKIIKE
jgi:hypothetical protein